MSLLLVPMKIGLRVPQKTPKLVLITTVKKTQKYTGISKRLTVLNPTQGVLLIPSRSFVGTSLFLPLPRSERVRGR